jgi:hypothetical protein
MNPKTPPSTLTWKKNHEYTTIDKFLHETIYFNRHTGKEEFSIKQVSEIPPIACKRKPKRK